MTLTAHHRHLLRSLPRFRDVWTTPGTHFAVRAEGYVARVVVGPRGGVRFRHATTAELDQLASA